MNINFECTLCGRCCHDLKVPLTVSEAIDNLALSQFTASSGTVSLSGSTGTTFTVTVTGAANLREKSP